MKSPGCTNSFEIRKNPPHGQAEEFFLKKIQQSTITMDKISRFFELKGLWKDASAEQRTKIDEEIDILLESMTPDEENQLNEAISSDFKSLHNKAAELKENIVKEKMSCILPLISVSYLSRKYFNRSPQWFYQRLNRNIVNGKPSKFTEKEIQILNDALQDISKEIGRIHLC
jgi:hypothetical protein